MPSIFIRPSIVSALLLAWRSVFVATNRPQKR